MRQRGFTFVEILIVLAIVGVLTLTLLFSFGRFGRHADIESAQLIVESVLQDARRRTLSSEGRQSFGVHFDVSGEIITLFEGSVYSSISGTNENISIPSAVDLVSIAVTGGGNDVIFDRLEGTTANNGTVVLQTIRDASVTKTIFVLPSGQASRVASPMVVDSRIIDTRHVHYDLGWSIQGGGNLILTFEDLPNPDVVEIVDLNCCYNLGETEFDWSGAIDVYGASQTLRIHTHILDAFNTILSIHRDRRENDKALEVQIQGNDIVRYEADGTITVQVFGGTETIQ